MKKWIIDPRWARLLGLAHGRARPRGGQARRDPATLSCAGDIHILPGSSADVPASTVVCP